MYDNDTSLYDNDTSLYDNDTSLYDNDTSLYDNDTSLYNNDTSLYDNTSLYANETLSFKKGNTTHKHINSSDGCVYNHGTMFYFHAILHANLTTPLGQQIQMQVNLIMIQRNRTIAQNGRLIVFGNYSVCNLSESTNSNKTLIVTDISKVAGHMITKLLAKSHICNITTAPGVTRRNFMVLFNIRKWSTVKGLLSNLTLSLNFTSMNVTSSLVRPLNIVLNATEPNKNIIILNITELFDATGSRNICRFFNQTNVFTVTDISNKESLIENVTKILKTNGTELDIVNGMFTATHVFQKIEQDKEKRRTRVRIKVLNFLLIFHLFHA